MLIQFVISFLKKRSGKNDKIELYILYKLDVLYDDNFKRYFYFAKVIFKKELLKSKILKNNKKTDKIKLN